jgi:hypothetical protein
MIAVISTPSSRKVDRIDLRAELAKLHRALLRDHDADQEAHQPDDAQRRDADHFESLDGRIVAEAKRGRRAARRLRTPVPAPSAKDAADNRQESERGRPQKAEQAIKRAASGNHGVADFTQYSIESGDMLRPQAHRLIGGRYLLEQMLAVGAQSLDRGTMGAGKAVDRPGADRVDPIDPRQVQPLDLAIIGVEPVGQVAQRRQRQTARETERARSGVRIVGEGGGGTHPFPP